MEASVSHEMRQPDSGYILGLALNLTQINGEVFNSKPFAKLPYTIAMICITQCTNWRQWRQRQSRGPGAMNEETGRHLQCWPSMSAQIYSNFFKVSLIYFTTVDKIKANFQRKPERFWANKLRVPQVTIFLKMLTFAISKLQANQQFLWLLLNISH